jgi:hypothetical protein
MIESGKFMVISCTFFTRLLIFDADAAKIDAAIAMTKNFQF